MKIEMTEDEVTSMMFGTGSPGVCLSCGMVDEYAGCEPDAMNYECPECGENELFGLEEAMMMGHIDFIE